MRLLRSAGASVASVSVFITVLVLAVSMSASGSDVFALMPGALCSLVSLLTNLAPITKGRIESSCEGIICASLLADSY